VNVWGEFAVELHDFGVVGIDSHGFGWGCRRSQRL